MCFFDFSKTRDLLPARGLSQKQVKETWKLRRKFESEVYAFVVFQAGTTMCRYQTFQDSEAALYDTVVMDIENVQCKELTLMSTIVEVNLHDQIDGI